MADPPLQQRPSRAAKPLLAASFTLVELAQVRHEVAAVSRRCGLDDAELEDWITAVNELLINAVRHGGGRGTVCLLQDDRFICEVTDHGPGFNAAHYLPRVERPPLSGTGGMGLWVIAQTADYVLVDSGSTGTTIRIAARTHATSG
jgi:serine/threonine-protein kinase RsbW